jgi:hypothetical protein
METNYTKESKTMKSNFGLAQRRRLLCTGPQGKPILPCFNTAPQMNSTLSNEKEPCKA